MLVRTDPEGSATGRSLTAALDRWPDGQPVHWQEAQPRGRPRMPLLYFAERRLRRDVYTVRANRLRGELVYYLEVIPAF